MSIRTSKSIAIIVLNVFCLAQLCFAAEKNVDSPHFSHDARLRRSVRGVCSLGLSIFRPETSGRKKPALRSQTPLTAASLKQPSLQAGKMSTFLQPLFLFDLS